MNDIIMLLNNLTTFNDIRLNKLFGSGVTTGPADPASGGAAFWRFVERIGKFMSNLTTVDGQKNYIGAQNRPT